MQTFQCTRRLSVLTAMLVFVIVLYGCESMPVDSYGGASPHMRKDYSSIQNPANPYNYVSSLHNEGLDYLYSRLSSQYSADTGTIVTYTYDFVCDSTWWSFGNGDIPPASIIHDCLDSGDYYWQVLTECNAPEVVQYIDAIINVLEDSTIAISESIPLLSNIESDIMVNLDTNAQGLPLLFVAAAKHSAAYWSDTTNWYKWFDLNAQSVRGRSGVNSWSKTRTKEKDPKKTDWGQVVKKDAIGMATGAVKGFIGGLVTGALGGSIGGPAGTVAGACGGAITVSLGGMVGGGVAASGAEYIRQAADSK